MRGPYQAGALIAAALTANVESQLRRIETVEGFVPGALGVPGLITATDPGQLALEQYPALLVSTRSVSATELTDAEPLEEEWDVTYQMQVEAVVAHSVPETVDALRYAWILATRQALLATRQLLDGIIVPTFTEAYDTVTAAGPGRFYAAAALQFPFTLTETLNRAEGRSITKLDLDAYFVGVRDTLHLPPTTQG